MGAASLRLWGLSAHAAVMAGALVLASLGGCEAPAPPPPTPVAPAPIPPTPQAPAPSMPASGTANVDAPIAVPAEAGEGAPAAPASAAPQTLTNGAGGAAAPPPSFLARFAAPHPMARAHRVAAAGDIAYARVLAVQAIRARPEMRGLCYGGFTAGGVEVILTACIPVSDVAAFHRRWQARLNRMQGVTYAEPNLIAQPSENSR